jgi:rhodanese-related sulfurtransferase
MNSTSKLLRLPVVLLIGVCSAALSGCFGGSQGSGTVTSVTAMETQGLLRNDFAVLVDVREKDELKGGMAQGARHFPFSQFSADSPEWKAFVAGLSKDKQVVLYCAVGGRAGKVADALAGQGFKVANMGGFEDWVKAGLPVTPPAP